MHSSKTVTHALSLCLAGCLGLGCLGLAGCNPTPWVDESVLLEAPAIIIVDPIRRSAGMAVVHGPRTLLVSGHQVHPGSILHVVSIDRALYTVRVTDGIFDPEAGGWLRLELGQPLAGSFRAFQRDYTTPIPPGDPVFVVCAIQPVDGPYRPDRPPTSSARRLNREISVIKSRVVPVPAWDHDGNLSEFLCIKAATGPGCSGSPVYWWPATHAAPIEIGVLSGAKVYFDKEERVVDQIALVRRPHELVIP